MKLLVSSPPKWRMQMNKTKLFFVAAGIAIGLGAVPAPAPVSAQPPPGDPDCAAYVSCNQLN